VLREDLLLDEGWRDLLVILERALHHPVQHRRESRRVLHDVCLSSLSLSQNAISPLAINSKKRATFPSAPKKSKEIISFTISLK
jgi:hypothetical protein